MGLKKEKRMMINLYKNVSKANGVVTIVQDVLSSKFLCLVQPQGLLAITSTQMPSPTCADIGNLSTHFLFPFIPLGHLSSQYVCGGRCAVAQSRGHRIPIPIHL